ncbi:uncharacterized protein NP_7008A (plasmid) [Natronomonas pharaonis DSM 2160]|uniref:Uncharacterized protein n=1 Tax=Natronomonas pharaonis (strain ATCC 35678 / DSM 2160 / CIP 103997 / JCM 8858 / NBRC 14720 / NCIMB 2260 / Gabara) TaxID=348780 RepID=Q3ILV0_NATPD|nr:hypothetical protein [Natronomonas pharaonis]CAI49733.1 uncharacterized protein NP_3284A [Natronomonas pharaonis DSM 2160]CAI50920.1 uncharacterized protein NP_7008A [Natronomonas pharaonis DSM 2160]
MAVSVDHGHEPHDLDGVLDADLAAELRKREADPAPTEAAESLFGAFNGPFFRELAQRKAENRDAKCLVTAKDGQTGIGKSNCCDFLGYVSDTSAAGFSEHKTTIDPFEFLDFYGHLPPGSATIMEEGEQFDARRSNSNKNIDAAERWQMARVREIIAFVNLPSPEEIDSRFERLADYWINIERRGFARVYKKRIHPTKRVLYYETLQTFEWPNMDDSESFKYMDALKDDRLDDGDHGSNWVRQSEVNEMVERARKEAREEERDKWIASVYRDTEMTGKDVARLEACEVSRGRVSQIASEVRD